MCISYHFIKLDQRNDDTQSQQETLKKDDNIFDSRSLQDRLGITVSCGKIKTVIEGSEDINRMTSTKLTPTGHLQFSSWSHRIVELAEINTAVLNIHFLDGDGGVSDGRLLHGNGSLVRFQWVWMVFVCASFQPFHSSGQRWIRCHTVNHNGSAPFNTKETRFLENLDMSFRYNVQYE